MGKKKRQSEPNMEEDNDSTESCDENQNATCCNHIGKAVDFSRVKKSLKYGLLTKCPDCTKDGPAAALENGLSDDDYEMDHSLWLCLKCGNQACGRSINKHALSHWRKPMSDCHALCVNTLWWSVWCYECDNMISANSKKKLLEIVEWLKKQSSAIVPEKPPKLGFYEIIADAVIQLSDNINGPPRSRFSADEPPVRGMYNMGNTCYFNAVVQCLAHTPFLIRLLDDMSDSSEKSDELFILPGGKITIDDKTVELSRLWGSVSGWCPLAKSLCLALKELTLGATGIFRPTSLLHHLRQQHSQFQGGDQHDSHELLRHLLEAVRSEDLRCYQVVILEKLDLSKKTDPSTVDSATKQILKFYGQQASDLMVRIDQLFRGTLVSTLQCQDCKHTSDREEFFLDLNLPVMADKQKPPVLRHKTDADLEESEKPSKYQLKKEKRLAKKSYRVRARQQLLASNEAMIAEEESPAAAAAAAVNKSESEESDADVEDNIEECRSPAANEDSAAKAVESGYNSGKVSDASPGLSGLETDAVGGVPSPGNMMAVDSPSSTSSEANIELPGQQLPSASPEDYERPVSRLSFTEKSAVDEKQQETGAMKSKVTSPCRWAGTVSNRYQCDDGECSIQSCLNQFTACELMTGNNKVGCENCTKNINGEGGKTVYTNATKQLLIASPPAVLILHLKRFQVSRCFTKKLSKDVSFPLVLDMAPFCSDKCRDLPSIAEQQNKLLYSLYGIVEHSGTLHGGHYVAYVKVRPEIYYSSYRWKFLSNPNNDERRQYLEDKPSDPAPPPGKWYYVSDSYVAEVPESQVLKAQAYLLFYERFL